MCFVVYMNNKGRLGYEFRNNIDSKSILKYKQLWIESFQRFLNGGYCKISKWHGNKIHNIGNYIQYLVTTYDGKELKYTYVCIWLSHFLLYTPEINKIL